MARTKAGSTSAVRWCAAGIACLLVVALSGVSGSVPAVALSDAGHWLYNHTIGVAVHVDGASKRVDARVPVPGVSAGSRIAEDSRNGYLVDRDGSRILEFGKADLRVHDTITTGSTQDPDIVRTPGATYLFFPDTRRIIRLGENGATIETRSAPASPVATSSGTVWFLVPATGDICRIEPTWNRFACPAAVPDDHRGRLVTLDDRPAFVDLTAARIVPVSADGLGPPLDLPTDLPLDARVAASDAGGRLPVVVRSGRTSRLLLLDTSTLGSRARPAATIEVPLGAGSYDAPVAAGGSVVVVNQSSRRISSYTSRGLPRGAITQRGGSGRLRATRGEDGRVYVDDRSGTRTTVVDGNGDITPVETGDSDGKTPVTPRTSPAPSSGPSEPSDRPNPSRSPGTSGSGSGSPRPGAGSSGPPGNASSDGPGGSGRPEPGGTGTRTSDRSDPPASDTPRVPEPSPTRTRKPRKTEQSVPRRGTKRTRSTPRDPGGQTSSTPPPKTSVPDAPPSVSVRTSGRKAIVSWSAPNADKAPIGAFRVVVRKGDSRVGRRKVDGDRRRATISGLKPGTYVATVAARNRAGWGAARESKSFTIGPATPKPSGTCRSAVLGTDPLLAYDLGGQSQLVTDTTGHGHVGMNAGLGTTAADGPCGTSALRLSGTAGLVTTGDTFSNPTVFTTQVWFRTTTTRGGALMGFGNDKSGDDARFDRHVYMSDDGRLTFGVVSDRVCVAHSPKSFNDGRWHLAVASLGAGGMRLYVDGSLVARNANTASLPYDARWNFGYANLSLWPNRPSSDFFTGDLALAAVWDRELTASQVAGLHRSP